MTQQIYIIYIFLDALNNLRLFFKCKVQGLSVYKSETKYTYNINVKYFIHVNTFSMNISFSNWLMVRLLYNFLNFPDHHLHCLQNFYLFNMLLIFYKNLKVRVDKVDGKIPLDWDSGKAYPPPPFICFIDLENNGEGYLAYFGLNTKLRLAASCI